MFKSFADYQEDARKLRSKENRSEKEEKELAWMTEAIKREVRQAIQRKAAAGYEITVGDDSDSDSEEEADMVNKVDKAAAQSARKPAQVDELAQQLQNLSIVREGNKIIIPTDMPYATVIEAMRMKIAEDEKKVDLMYDFDLMVPEGALALFRTLDDIYGFIRLMDTPHFFGDTPPTILTVQVSKEHTQMIPWGRFAVPGVPGYIETSVNWVNKIPFFKLKASIPAGFKMEIQTIVDHMKARTDSVYKGAAIKVKFPDPDDAMSTQDFFPRFMDLADITEDQLIFSRDVADIVDMTLFTPIQKTEFCREHGIPLKRGILLEGPPGVGKTLTASVTATMAQKNGWTFIQTDDVHDLPRVYKFAMHHQPAVIFCEDLDLVLKEAKERDDVINSILNSIDGIESKKLEVLLVLTTNFVGKITKASLRPGRIDAVVPVRAPDAEAARRLIWLYAGDSMNPSEDLTVAGELLGGKMAAVVREVVERSKLSAIRRLTGTGQLLTITARDIEVAAHGMAAHNALLEPESEDERTPIEKAASILVEGLRSSGASNGKGQGPYTLEELQGVVKGLVSREQERLPFGAATYGSSTEGGKGGD